MRYLLRPPCAADYEALATWIPDAVACARWAGPQLAYPFAAGELPILLAGPLTQGYALATTASPGEMLAFGQLVEKTTDTLRLARIIVHPKRRGRGLGQAICRALLDEGRTRGGFRHVTLGVYRDNEQAIALYRRPGFREDAVNARPEIMAMALTLAEH